MVCRFKKALQLSTFKLGKKPKTESDQAVFT